MASAVAREAAMLSSRDPQLTASIHVRSAPA
jgi:hypothetical protein